MCFQQALPSSSSIPNHNRAWSSTSSESSDDQEDQIPRVEPYNFDIDQSTGSIFDDNYITYEEASEASDELEEKEEEEEVIGQPHLTTFLRSDMFPLFNEREDKDEYDVMDGLPPFRTRNDFELNTDDYNGEDQVNIGRFHSTMSPNSNKSPLFSFPSVHHFIELVGR